MRWLAAFCLIVLPALAACTPAPGEAVVSAIPARILDAWTPLPDAFTADDLAREWRLLGQKRDEILVSVTSSSALQVVLTDGTGVALAQGNPLRAVLPETGTYRVVVAALAPADYEILLTFANQPPPTPTFTATFTPSATFTLSPTPLKSNTPTPTITPTATPLPTSTPVPVYAPLGDLRGQLTPGEAVEGRFISSFERHIFLFEGRAGQFATLALAGQDAVDGALALFAPGGQLIAMDDDSGAGRNALLNGIRLDSDGLYIVQVTNGGGAGAYTLALTLAGVPPTLAAAAPEATVAPLIGLVTPIPAGGPDLADHAPVLGRLNAPGMVARYTLRLNAGDLFTVAAQPAAGSPLLPRIQLVNPAGEIMFETGLLAEAGGALLPALGVVEAGVYSVYLSGDRGTFGDFVLSFGLGQSHTSQLRGFAPMDTAVDGALIQRGLRDIWPIDLAQGERVRVTLIPLVGGFAPSLALTGPDGRVLASADARRGAPNPELEAEAFAAGRYQIEVTGGSALTYGPYRLQWSRLNEGPPATPVPAAVAVLTAFDRLAEGEYLDYVFQGAAGDQFRLRVVAITPGLDPVAALIAPDGVLMAHADDSPGSLNPDVEVTLPASGSYIWRVNGYNGAAGEIEVRVERLVSAPAPG